MAKLDTTTLGASWLSYVDLYMNHFVIRFRQYNNDGFSIAISGLGKFIEDDSKIITCLIEQFNQNNFHISLIGEEDNISRISVECKNQNTNQPYNFQYQIQDLTNCIELSSKTNIPIAGIFVMKIVARIITKTKILYKALVLDLDNTLWTGTLSEMGIDNIIKKLSSKQGKPFIAFMKFCKILAKELGIFIAICSRNNSNEVENAIQNISESVFPLKNQIDVLVANNNDKSRNIKMIAEKLGIMSDSIIFIDDNQIVRDEVKNKLRNVFVPEWTNHYELLTQLIVGCFFERNELSLTSKNRRKQYQIIKEERAKNHLPELFIKVIEDKSHIESCKLYAKSNQFKFSSNNDTFDDNAQSVCFEIYRENGENLGICSAITYSITDKTIMVHNWAMSCRYFQIGVEELILLYVAKIANNRKIEINYQKSEYNSKVDELSRKYSDIFKKNDNNKYLNIIFTEESINNITTNTRLKEIL
jgi:FkbH-like protein